MEIRGLYQFLRAKKYQPDNVDGDPEPSRRHLVDVASFYSKIRQAYVAAGPDEAHLKVEYLLKQCGKTSNVVAYFDGHAAEEKERAAVERDKGLQELRNKMGERPQWLNMKSSRKLKKAIRDSWTWILEDRQKLAQYLRERGWTVIVAEADVAIAQTAQLTTLSSPLTVTS
ncbi:hypothetical protein BGZ65_011426 [Modicella reniformis]|uniref:Uncharacterized protein n=1 Tax=Modicella reniformis TaxID=1440133 RepID=A0A9P6IH70_9FUNG|nr:hypothetical protein BGZ65_011426 [Modicella reniformis]